MAVQHHEHLKEFFLNLARPLADTDEARAAARERWNAWRRDPANEDVRVTFEGVDFRTAENAGIQFARFEFGDWAQFGGASFGDWARFGGASFGNEARFGGASFGDWAQFDGASFGDRAQFDGASFGDDAQFDGASFGDDAQFDGASFGDGARFGGASFGYGAQFGGASFGYGAQFGGASFGNEAQFDGASFGDWARFGGASFGDWAQFDGASFGDWARFGGASFGDWASFRATLLQGSADFSGEPLDKWAAREGARRFGPNAPGTDEDKAARRAAFDEALAWAAFGPQRFLAIDFSDARILGDATFAHRRFERPANFTGVQFHRPPDFDGASDLQLVDFTGARVSFAPPGARRLWPHLTNDSRVPIRLRAFRSIAEQTKNHDLERDLYIEERKAERGVYWERHIAPLRARGVTRALEGLSGWTDARAAFSGETGAKRIYGHRLQTRKDIAARRRLLRSRWRRAARVRETPEAVAQLAVHALWIGAMFFYWAFSDYGRSLVRPLFWLFVSLPLFIMSYDSSLASRRADAAADAARMAVAAGPSVSPEAASRDAQRDFLAATRQLAISNMIPFVGPLSVDPEVKKFLLCGAPLSDETKLKSCAPIAPRGYQLTLIGQNLFAAMMFFFFGLALRNYFKVK